ILFPSALIDTERRWFYDTSENDVRLGSGPGTDIPLRRIAWGGTGEEPVGSRATESAGLRHSGRESDSGRYWRSEPAQPAGRYARQPAGRGSRRPGRSAPFAAWH